jgi:hypothetical protein
MQMHCNVLSVCVYVQRINVWTVYMREGDGE